MNAPSGTLLTEMTVPNDSLETILMRHLGSYLACFGLFVATIGCGPSTSSGVAGKGANDTEADRIDSASGVAESAQSAGKVNTELQGRVEIDGSSTVFLISRAAASKFRKQFPNVGVSVGVSGTGAGFERFTKGETDISDASRPIKDSEFAIAKKSKISFVELPVAYDGLTLVVHKDNDWVDQLTLEEIRKIFTTEGSAETWSEVRSGWPATQIKVFSPGTDSGTFDYFLEVVAGKEGSIRADISTSEDDNVLVTGVAGSPSGIGFFGVAYYEENKDKLKAVPIVNPETQQAVMPTPATIKDGEYAPFSRPLFIYVNSKSLSRPEVKIFTKFFMDHAAELATQSDYVALPEEVYAAAAARLKSRQTGTHYLTAEGAKREGPITEVYTTANLVDIQ